MSAAGRLAWGVGRLVLVAGVAAGAVRVAETTSWSADLSTATRSTTTGTSQTTVREAELICPGRELTGIPGVRDVATPGRVTAAAPPAATVTPLLGRPPGAGTLHVGALSAGASTGSAPSPSSVSAGLPASGAVAVGATKGLAPGLVATQEWSTTGTSLRGLVTASCLAPTDDAWLVGGAGAPGRQERLVLANPGANVVTADVALIGASGPVRSPNGTGVVVPAHGRTTILLDALSSTEKSPVAHVTTRGGLVYAALADTWLDGSVPAGADDVTPTAAPGRTVVIPAVALAGQGRLRVAVTGSHEAVVQVRTLSASGGAPLPKGGVATVAGHSVAEFDLSGVPAGTYAVQVTSDEPVVAGAVVFRRSGSGVGDFAWSAAAEPVGVLAGTTFPATSGRPPSRTLGLVSSGATATVAVTVVAKDGRASTRAVGIGEDSTASLALPSGVRAIWVHRTAGTGAVRGAVVSTVPASGSPLISVVGLAPAPLTAASTAVVPLP
ncbi:putative secreted protein [Nostocoides japonicum T1-X7]|uniref:Putative secreted protein n=1 Tax=Nostocoides japonicum T1-X7 TaxID=1194083 RepID=A0A077M2D4_9MICO|nr:DUF5719 family protein [Tetrasphaera japonica]CCH78399.1 putative secreted protein [Tetrasphaera japonica T1-X7]